MKCPTCQLEITDKLGIEAIKSIGECLACDHVRGEREEMIRDMRDEIELDDDIE